MSVDLAHPPPNPSPEIALSISQLAPKFLKNAPKPASWPWSLLSSDPPAETWASLETLYVQCLRTGDDKSAKDILDRLIARYGDKNDRVMAYQGMWEEAMARNDVELNRVLEIYEKILEGDPSNFAIHKRKITLLKSMGNKQEAIAQLVKLLDTSPTDAEAWAELADMYLEQGMSEQAIYCLEEVLLIQPNAWNIHAKLAEIIYSSAAATIQNPPELARAIAESMRRYLRSTELCENYLRGYYGLKFTTSKLLPLIAQASKQSVKDSAYADLALPTEGTVEALHELATEKLAEIVRRSAAKEKYWDGYDPAELKAARELLDQETKGVQR